MERLLLQMAQLRIFMTQSYESQKHKASYLYFIT